MLYIRQQNDNASCFACGKHIEAEDCEPDLYPVYGQVSETEAYEGMIVVNKCKDCAKFESNSSLIAWAIILICAIFPIITTIKQVDSLFDLWPLVVIVVLAFVAHTVVVDLMSNAFGMRSSSGLSDDCPAFGILSKYGWQLGTFTPDGNSEGHPAIADNMQTMIAELNAAGWSVE